MPSRDDDFIPYQDRPLPWESRRDRARGSSTADHARPGEPSPGRSGCGCSGGCGCLLAILIAIVLAGIGLARAMPTHAGAGLLNLVVNAAIDGEITVTTNSRQRRITTPPEWHQPWRATADAYGTAFIEGTVGREAFYDCLWDTTVTVFGAEGEIDAEDLRALCEEMRSVLPAATVDALPPLPPVVGLTTVAPPSNASVPDTESTWAPRDALAGEELTRQYQLRRALLTTLSRRRGTSTAQQLIPETALLFDFAYGVLPLAEVMDHWAVVSPEDGTMEVAISPRHGFAAPPSLHIAATPRVAQGTAGVSFSTTAGNLQFWYAFQGPAHSESRIRVLVDGREVYTDPWPTSSPGPLGGSEWRHMRLTGLTPGTPSQVDIRAIVSGTDENCFLFIDDLVFAP